MDDLTWLVEYCAERPEERVCQIEVPDIKAEPEFGGEHPTMRIDVINPYYSREQTTLSNEEWFVPNDTTILDGTANPHTITYTGSAPEQVQEPDEIRASGEVTFRGTLLELKEYLHDLSIEDIPQIIRLETREDLRGQSSVIQVNIEGTRLVYYGINSTSFDSNTTIYIFRFGGSLST